MHLPQSFFLKKTAVGIEIYGKSKKANIGGTVLFIRLVVKWWTILNVKNKGLDLRKRQPLQAVISDQEDTRLDFILEFGRKCLKMEGR